MIRSSHDRGRGPACRAAASLLLLGLGLGACRAAGAEAGTPAERPGSAPPRAAASAAAIQQARYSEADVRFMQHMIVHHAQALEMSRMVPGRTDSEDIRRLARRIEMAQEDEIAMMQRWLTSRGHPAPRPDAAAGHGHHGHHAHGAPPGDDHADMPGMLSAEELARLSGARGAEFDRLFLVFMIRHHEGALVMVEELFEADGAQDGETFQLASHMDSDQKIEITRMQRMLATRR
jgi:uncharacterized protein (DUF305 family)